MIPSMLPSGPVSSDTISHVHSRLGRIARSARRRRRVIQIQCTGDDRSRCSCRCPVNFTSRTDIAEWWQLCDKQRVRLKQLCQYETGKSASRWVMTPMMAGGPAPAPARDTVSALCRMLPAWDRQNSHKPGVAMITCFMAENLWIAFTQCHLSPCIWASFGSHS